MIEKKALRPAVASGLHELANQNKIITLGPRARRDVTKMTRHFVDAEPARQHLRVLQDLGISRGQIAAKIPVTQRTLVYIARGRRSKILADTAEQILAIDPKEMAPFDVDAGPARQRIRELLQRGVSRARIAAISKIDRKTLLQIDYARRRRIRPETAAAILALNPEAVAPFEVDAVQTMLRINRLQTNHGMSKRAIGWFLNTRFHLQIDPQRVRFETSERVRKLLEAAQAIGLAEVGRVPKSQPIELQITCWLPEATDVNSRIEEALSARVVQAVVEPVFKYSGRQRCRARIVMAIHE